MFEDFPISVFENAPMWTDLEDTELLKFVCDQNGLFQDAVFVDWYCSINYEVNFDQNLFSHYLIWVRKNQLTSRC